jgi:hypothetical protein
MFNRGGAVGGDPSSSSSSDPNFSSSAPASRSSRYGRETDSSDYGSEMLVSD